MKFGTILLISTLILSVFIQPTQNMRLALSQNAPQLNNKNTNDNKTEKPVAKAPVVENKTEKPVAKTPVVENKTEKPAAPTAKVAPVASTTAKAQQSEVNKIATKAVMNTPTIEKRVVAPIAQSKLVNQVGTNSNKQATANVNNPLYKQAPVKTINQVQQGAITNQGNASVDKINKVASAQLRKKRQEDGTNEFGKGKNSQDQEWTLGGNVDVKAKTVNDNKGETLKGDYMKPIMVPTLAENKLNKGNIPDSFQPVEKVKELTPAGKAALEAQNSPDIMYQKLLKAGFETPKMTTPIFQHFETNVHAAAKPDFLWSHGVDGRDKNMWQNIEYNRYGNNIQDKQSWFGVPAKFDKDQFGGQRVDAPPNSAMQITGPVPTIHNYGFLETEDKNTLINDSGDNSAQFKVIDTDKEDIFAKYTLVDDN